MEKNKVNESLKTSKKYHFKKLKITNYQNNKY